jgi:protein KRI1
MAKRKADILSQNVSSKSPKKVKHEVSTTQLGLLEDSDSSSSDESDGGAKLDGPGFKINEEYAKRFEHNKKREELQRC